MPMPFVSFYNIVSPELIDDYTETFKPENTRVIHISPVIRHDDVYVSLRIPRYIEKLSYLKNILLWKRIIILILFMMKTDINSVIAIK